MLLFLACLLRALNIDRFTHLKMLAISVYIFFFICFGGRYRITYPIFGILLIIHKLSNAWFGRN